MSAKISFGTSELGSCQPVNKLGIATSILWYGMGSESVRRGHHR